MRFDWDRDKEAVNVAKHGVDFSEAQSAFADPLLVLASDKGHSQKEPRLFCIGRSGRGGIDSRCQSLFRFPRGLDRLPIGFPARRVHTLLRFTYRGETIRIIGAGYWRKGKKIYEEKNG